MTHDDIIRKPLTEEQKLDLVTNWFSEDWAIKNALGLLDDYDTVRAHGIGEQAMSEKPEALVLAEELYAFHAAKKEMPSVGGQMLGLERYRIVASGEAFSQIRDAADKLIRQHAESERLWEALKKYGQHRSDCAVVLGGYQCTCGFNQQEQPR